MTKTHLIIQVEVLITEYQHANLEFMILVFIPSTTDHHPSLYSSYDICFDIHVKLSPVAVTWH